MSVFTDKPPAFFEIVIHDIMCTPGLTGVSAGYERGKWRNEAMADYLFDWLPEFALKYSDLEDMNSVTAMRLIKSAAKTVYTTPKYAKRGEFGELLLHALIREVFDSQPAISKIYYKSATNDTVKGFDAVHVVDNAGELELWLGEVKFYKDIAAAIRDVTAQLAAHMATDYLRDEFILITSKVDSKWQHAEKLKQLISDRTSLDTVFKRTCLPVLLTYESDCVSKHQADGTTYKAALELELRAIYAKFATGSFPPVRIHLFLIPLDKKDALVGVLQSKLEGLQR